MESKYVAYYRVSTRSQETSHLGLDAQRDAVLKYIRNNGNRIIAEFTEVESGKRDNRPELTTAVNLCKTDGATLVVAKLDRLYRDVYFTTKLMKDKVKFVCCDIPEATDLTIHIFAAIAEWERKEISRRTRAALSAKRQNDPTWRPGTDNLTPEARLQARQSISQKARQDENSRKAYHYISLLKGQGLSLHAIARRLNAENYRTRTGKLFHYSQVKNIWERFNNKEI